MTVPLMMCGEIISRIAENMYTVSKRIADLLKVKQLHTLSTVLGGVGGLEVACWPLVPKFAGSKPAEAGFFRAKKILSTPSFGAEVKPSVPCRRFTACKRSLDVTWKSGISGKIHR
jgi:hypothetical protein